MIQVIFKAIVFGVCFQMDSDKKEKGNFVDGEKLLPVIIHSRKIFLIMIFQICMLV